MSVRRKLAGLVALLLALLPHGALAREWDVASTRTLRETLTFEGGGRRRLQVDNVNGEIRVTAHAADKVEIVVTETIRARTADRAARAREEVHLDMTADGVVADLYVDGPFRDREDRRAIHWGRHGDPGYRVIYDFELRVPADCDLDLRTVNGGEIRVEGVRGDFALKNVNGGIEVIGADGSGDVGTVNGEIHVEFAGNPRAATGFETVNGDIEVLFRDDLAADLRLVTQWGEMWSDFDVAALPPPPPRQSRRGGLLVIEAGAGANFRVAAGGPQISFETLNGDILIRKSRKGR